ncbi:MAG: MATE family efflux transporter [Clostridia bacterium]|nr:MATE family efflux transporter [Clostridia bacterium]
MQKQNNQTLDLTRGPVIRSMLVFAWPLIAGNLLQQCYNIADTLIVGRLLGQDALAAVGSAFSLMTFLTSIILGLCMGSGALFAIRIGEKDDAALRESLTASFLLTAASTVLLTVVSYGLLGVLGRWLRVPDSVWPDMRSYLLYIFAGIPAVSLYNYYASALRSAGNSITPLWFLAAAAVINVVLDLFFVMHLRLGVWSTALATAAAQYAAGVSICLWTVRRFPLLRLFRGRPAARRYREVAAYSLLTCAQQSVMNLGILTVQGLVNSFGAVTMAAFAAGVKIDAFAYAPCQDFGNAFSTFIAQNYGAGKEQRIRAGLRGAVLVAAVFSALVSLLVFVFARPLMELFVSASQTAIVRAGCAYLRTEGAFYPGIACLFLFYGLFRALARPGISLVLTIISLGSRVALAYILSIPFGPDGIWWSVPIGWGLADLAGLLFCRAFRRRGRSL